MWALQTSSRVVSVDSINTVTLHRSFMTHSTATFIQLWKELQSSSIFQWLTPVAETLWYHGEEKRPDQMWKTAGVLQEAKKTFAWVGVGTLWTFTAVSSKLTVNTNHVLCACVRVRMCVCLVTLLCQCALNGYHVQVPTFFSNWMKDGRDCEKFSVTFVKMLVFFFLLQDWNTGRTQRCSFQGRDDLSGRLVGNDAFCRQHSTSL